jgi:hypothetical protein
MIAGNIAFQVASERKNPPIGIVIEWTECRFTISNGNKRESATPLFPAVIGKTARHQAGLFRAEPPTGGINRTR